MIYAVLGTGVVGQTIAAKLADLGHTVVVGTRDPEAARARTDPDRYGRPGLGAWLAEHAEITLATLSDAAAASDVVFNATSGDSSVAALTEAGPDNLADKVLIDVSNPLDTSVGFPPQLFVKDTDSLAEQIQRAAPRAKVVKTLNTVTASIMVDPGQVGAGDHTVFMSGDDADAKTIVAELLRSFGWLDILDLGDLSTARGPELYRSGSGCWGRAARRLQHQGRPLTSTSSGSAVRHAARLAHLVERSQVSPADHHRPRRTGRRR